ncbi:hypothetical protein MKEN_01260400 [Mycena kentingensis (nom. inval.)]|nr:hypothetical protein MKEN_01260400 [Mycena kentingensis (nom. inval.)]
MTLIVPALRLIMLALNMYDTYKVLKPPRISSRSRDGRTAERALSQRKRKMKGCLAVWIVWCCYMSYERSAEAIVSMFIPFYDSCKSLVLLFLILTRARGAEPIFLHVIRPLLRPYTATLDAVADVGRIFGDVIFLFLTYPFTVGAEWWNTYWTPTEQEEEVPRRLSHPISLQPGGGRQQTTPRENGQHVAAAVAAYANAALYQVWHPPRSAYDDDDDPPMPIPPLVPEESAEEALARKQQEEWRQYPPLPSAYPPTPLPLHRSVPPDPPVFSEEGRRQLDEWRRYPDFPSAYPATPLARPASISAAPSISAIPALQFAPILEEEDEEGGDELEGFGQSLPSQPELPNPGSVRDVSDNSENALGIYEEMEEDDDDEDDEFDVTLRTPETLRTPMTRSRARNVSPVPLLSRLSSVSDALEEGSGSGPMSGRKRSRDLVSPATSDESTSTSPVTRTKPKTLDLAELSTTESESETGGTEEDSEAEVERRKPPVTSTKPKRRKVVGDDSTPRRVQPRRGSREPTAEPAQPQTRRGKVAAPPPASRSSSRTAAPEPVPRSSSRRSGKK